MKKIIIVLLLVVLAGGGWYVYRMLTGRNPDLAHTEAAYSLSVNELLAAFNKDSALAGKQYTGQVLLIQGHVTRIDTAGVISLGQAGEMSSVECTMDKRHRAALQHIKEGQSLSVKGRCTGYKSESMLDVNLGTTVEMNFCLPVIK
ncbi:MAG TPA: hypothetical protein VFR58_11415 [Flavisolibacter sp.]|nr:hypothetical protein [Flavisolibacter sp.]